MNDRKKIAVPRNTLAQWHLRYCHGDKTIMREKGIGTRQALADAFIGYATPKVIDAINKFYSIN